jgi:hypothetical protein
MPVIVTAADRIAAEQGWLARPEPVAASRLRVHPAVFSSRTLGVE